MPIEPQKALAAKFAPSTSSYDADDVILYHLGIGAGVPATDPNELEYTYEKSLKVLPSFCVVPVFSSMGGAVRRRGPQVQPGHAAARRAGHRDPSAAADVRRSSRTRCASRASTTRARPRWSCSR